MSLTGAENDRCDVTEMWTQNPWKWKGGMPPIAPFPKRLRGFAWTAQSRLPSRFSKESSSIASWEATLLDIEEAAFVSSFYSSFHTRMLNVGRRKISVYKRGLPFKKGSREGLLCFVRFVFVAVHRSSPWKTTLFLRQNLFCFSYCPTPSVTKAF